MRARGATFASSAYHSVCPTRVIVPTLKSNVPSVCSPHPVTSETMRGTRSPIRCARNVTVASDSPSRGAAISGVACRPASMAAIAASRASATDVAARPRGVPRERSSWRPYATTHAKATTKTRVRRRMILEFARCRGRTPVRPAEGVTSFFIAFLKLWPHARRRCRAARRAVGYRFPRSLRASMRTMYTHARVHRHPTPLCRGARLHEVQVFRCRGRTPVRPAAGDAGPDRGSRCRRREPCTGAHRRRETGVRS